MKNGDQQLVGTAEEQLQLSRRPTFGEFAAYLVRERVENYDNHWLPYWLHCHACSLEYDVIAKMETFEDDMNFVTGRVVRYIHNLFYNNQIEISQQRIINII
jgi:Sulfotransferase family